MLCLLILSANSRIRLERSAGDDLNSLVKADNSERYIECLVVIDQKMVNYHGEDAASQFALVVLNIVSPWFAITYHFCWNVCRLGEWRNFLKCLYS